MDDLVFLHGVALANYRGIGEKLQRIGPFQRFNFFIGPNNAGKSCVLHFIAHYLKPWVWEERWPSSVNKRKDLDVLDIHLGASRQQVIMGTAVSAEQWKAELRTKHSIRIDNLDSCDLLDKIFSALTIENCLWVERQRSDGKITLIEGRPGFMKNSQKIGLLF